MKLKIKWDPASFLLIAVFLVFILIGFALFPGSRSIFGFSLGGRLQWFSHGKIVRTAYTPTTKSLESGSFFLSAGEELTLVYNVQRETGSVYISVTRVKIFQLGEQLWNQVIRTTAKEEIRLPISHADAGRYRVYIYLFDFKGNIEVEWKKANQETP